ncbi:MAG: hypothetical protein KGL96_03630 [Hyphomicrobiales bacterium]|jgi:hypothetical protein|nr:hypothetical protein [Hyphomicrobiales bacterium]
MQDMQPVTPISLMVAEQGTQTTGIYKKMAGQGPAIQRGNEPRAALRAALVRPSISIQP